MKYWCIYATHIAKLEPSNLYIANLGGQGWECWWFPWKWIWWLDSPSRSSLNPCASDCNPDLWMCPWIAASGPLGSWKKPTVFQGSRSSRWPWLELLFLPYTDPSHLSSLWKNLGPLENWSWQVNGTTSISPSSWFLWAKSLISVARRPQFFFYFFFIFTPNGVLLPAYRYCNGQFPENLILPNVLWEPPKGIGAISLPAQMVRSAYETLNCWMWVGPWQQQNLGC